MHKVINKETAEIITIDENTSAAQLSEALRIVKMEMKELESIEEAIKNPLTPYVQKAFEDGETTFMNYWTIQRGQRRFNEDLFMAKASKKDIAKYKELKKGLEDLTDKYKVAGDPFLKFPRLG